MRMHNGEERLPCYSEPKGRFDPDRPHKKEWRTSMEIECLTPEFPQGARVYSSDGIAPTLLNSASAIYDGVVSVLEKEPAANVVPRPAPKWPICQNCGKPMVYCGEENTDGIVWKRYSCKDCYNQFCARRMLAGEETWPK
jgi:hypothetical protein